MGVVVGGTVVEVGAGEEGVAAGMVAAMATTGVGVSAAAASVGFAGDDNGVLGESFGATQAARMKLNANNGNNILIAAAILMMDSPGMGLASCYVAFQVSPVKWLTI